VDLKEKTLLRKIFELNDLIVSYVSKENVDELTKLCEEFENNLKKVIKKSQLKEFAPLWEKFSAMTEEEIRQEFSNTEKYPDLDSIKQAVKGYIDMRKVSKVKTRETLIKHIINTYKRGEFISKIGKEKSENAH
jgi:hypothetical protein